jgi:hypothetical protein
MIRLGGYTDQAYISDVFSESCSKRNGASVLIGIC